MLGKVFFELYSNYASEDEKFIMNFAGCKAPTPIAHRLHMLKVTNVQYVMTQCFLLFLSILCVSERLYPSTLIGEEWLVKAKEIFFQSSLFLIHFAPMSDKRMVY